MRRKIHHEFLDVAFFFTSVATKDKPMFLIKNNNNYIICWGCCICSRSADTSIAGKCGDPWQVSTGAVLLLVTRDTFMVLLPEQKGRT